MQRARGGGIVAREPRSSWKTRRGVLEAFHASTARRSQDVFEACYLAKDKDPGTCTSDPDELALGQDPLDGNVVVTIFATKTTTNSTCPDCVDNFLDALKSDNLTAILAESGLRRPF